MNSDEQPIAARLVAHDAVVTAQSATPDQIREYCAEYGHVVLDHKCRRCGELIQE